MENKIQQLTEMAAELGYRLEIQDSPVITGALFKPTPKARLNKEKMVYGYRFKSMEQCLEHVEKQLVQYKTNIEVRATMKEEAKVRAKLEAEQVQVGDIFHASWGFEQTQCDFYQVVEKPSATTVILRRIGMETVETSSWASEYVKPTPNQFISEELIKKRINGKWIKFSSYNSASKIDMEKDKKFYRSWYY